ncbi:MAG: hypothetical protein QNJ68_07630 [Microcoleaceae cyanobacterium MO_207.B10]|nr:hypothetical protein [Microcoleaceae cyanobacterium MO_207.B10]
MKEKKCKYSYPLVSGFYCNNPPPSRGQAFIEFGITDSFALSIKSGISKATDLSIYTFNFIIDFFEFQQISIYILLRFPIAIAIFT